MLLIRQIFWPAIAPSLSRGRTQQLQALAMLQLCTSTCAIPLIFGIRANGAEFYQKTPNHLFSADILTKYSRWQVKTSSFPIMRVIFGVDSAGGSRRSVSVPLLNFSLNWRYDQTNDCRTWASSIEKRMVLGPFLSKDFLSTFPTKKLAQFFVFRYFPFFFVPILERKRS